MQDVDANATEGAANDLEYIDPHDDVTAAAKAASVRALGITDKLPPSQFDVAMAEAVSASNARVAAGPSARAPVTATEPFDLEASLRALIGETSELRSEHSRSLAASETPTNDMFREVQELLQVRNSENVNSFVFIVKLHVFDLLCSHTCICLALK